MVTLRKKGHGSETKKKWDLTTKETINGENTGEGLHAEGVGNQEKHSRLSR